MKEKTRNVPCGSRISFKLDELDDKELTGISWRDDHDGNKVYVSEPGPSRNIELPPDKEVEILERRGFQLTVTEV